MSTLNEYVPPSKAELNEMRQKVGDGQNVSRVLCLITEIVRLRALLGEMVDKTGPYLASERWADELYDQARKASKGEL